ncbi:hypothetical protein K6U36_19665 [Vibrio alginolyticus]|nr:hypothetical protein [Vibrio alginolyticus]MCG6334019.1 hypothetical protein [Vibrio alginolyticus]
MTIRLEEVEGFLKSPDTQRLFVKSIARPHVRTPVTATSLTFSISAGQ